MNGSGIAALIQGFQQGYTFMDDAQRKQAKDAREDKRFAWEERDQQQKDDYLKEAQAIQDEYFPRGQQPSLTPFAANGAMPAGAPQAAAAPVVGAMPGPAVQPIPAGAPDATAGKPVVLGTAAPAALPSAAPAFSASASKAPVAKQAAANGGAVPVGAQPNPLTNMNNVRDFMIKRATLDMKYGKLDGPGMLTLLKATDGWKREKMDDAIKLLHQGRFDEAAQEFDSAGDHTGYRVIDAKDDVFVASKTKVPTKIVTVQDAQGNIRTINTAQTLFQQQQIDKIISQAQQDRATDVQEQHGKEVVAASREGNQLKYKASMADVGVKIDKFNWEKAKEAAGGLTLEKLEKAGERIHKAATDVYSPKEGMTPDERRLLEADRSKATVEALGIYKQAYALGAPVDEYTAMRAAQMAREKNNLVQMRHTDGNVYPGVMVNGRFVPVGGRMQAPSPRMTAASAPQAKAPAAARGTGMPAKDTSGAVDISQDPVLSSLRQAMAKLDANDPQNTDAITKIGQARNVRLQQLQQQYGRMTPLKEGA